MLFQQLRHQHFSHWVRLFTEALPMNLPSSWYPMNWPTTGRTWQELAGGSIMIPSPKTPPNQMRLGPIICLAQGLFLDPVGRRNGSSLRFVNFPDDEVMFSPKRAFPFFPWRESYESAKSSTKIRHTKWSNVQTAPLGDAAPLAWTKPRMHWTPDRCAGKRTLRSWSLQSQTPEKSKKCVWSPNKIHNSHQKISGFKSKLGCDTLW